MKLQHLRSFLLSINCKQHNPSSSYYNMHLWYVLFYTVPISFYINHRLRKIRNNVRKVLKNIHKFIEFVVMSRYECIKKILKNQQAMDRMRHCIASRFAYKYKKIKYIFLQSQHTVLIINRFNQNECKK